MALLALSRHLSFHARGDAAYAWHGLTGDVAEMSRDVLALLLAFEPAADEAIVLGAPPAGLTREQVDEFVPVLRARRFLVHAPAGGRVADEAAPLLVGFPRVPRVAVYRRTEGKEGEPPRITVFARGVPIELDPLTAALFDRCTGERTLGQVLGDAGPSALEPLLRLARADAAALKILPKAVSLGGVQLNPSAESTMPYPRLIDARAYAAGGPAPEHEEQSESTLSQLFSEPHPSLKGRDFGGALASGLLLRGAFKEVRGRAARMLEVGGGPGVVGEAMRAAFSSAPQLGELKVRQVNLELAPALARAQRSRGLAVARGDARLLPARAEGLDLIVANEMAGELGTGIDPAAPAGSAPGPAESAAPRLINHGALQLVREAAAALAPGGILYLSEFGDPKADPLRSDHPGREQWSIRFADLQAEATRCGLGARVYPLGEVIGLDGNHQALSTTHASYAALRALFAQAGLALEKRAWLRSEIEKLCEGKLDLSEVHGLQWTPLSERTMGLSPRQFWALIATKPARTLH